MNQLMPIFENLRQKEDLPCSYPLHMHAPSYHWVRERSVRSVPMQMSHQTRASRSSLGAGTPDSLSDNESSFRTPARKASSSSMPYRSTLTPGGSRPSSRPASRPASRSGSRPASRQGSKPSSRYGSTHSLDSTDENGTPSRIPRRTSTSGNTPTSSRHNSLSGKRLSVSTLNGSSSRPRTPTGLVNPTASSTPVRLSSINRASSIPSLSAVGTPTSRSRIPVYVGSEIKSPQSTTSNISTHSTHSNHSTISSDSNGMKISSSGSSTPLPPTSKLTRKSSGASDTSTLTSLQRKGKSSLSEQKIPFRL